MTKHSIAKKVLSRIYGKGRGWCFTPSRYYDLGRPATIRVILFRLTEKGTIRRLAQGLYDYPRRHKTIGLLSPKPFDVARALAEKDAYRLQPSDATAANMLGLTEQVPAKILFLTDGPSKKKIVDGREIILQKTAPKKMIAAGRMSGTVISALRFIGNNQIREDHIRHLRKILTSKEKEQLLRDVVVAPSWMRSTIERITEQVI